MSKFLHPSNNHISKSKHIDQLNYNFFSYAGLGQPKYIDAHNIYVNTNIFLYLHVYVYMDEYAHKSSTRISPLNLAYSLARSFKHSTMLASQLQ